MLIVPLLVVAGVSSKAAATQVSGVDVAGAPSLTKLMVNKSPELETGIPVPIWADIMRVPGVEVLVRILQPLVKAVVLTGGFCKPRTEELKVKLRSKDMKEGG